MPTRPPSSYTYRTFVYIKTCILYKDMAHFNSLCPNDAIWRQRSGSALAQVMACCLTAPSHYLNQCWLIIKGVLWHSPESNFTGNAQDINAWNEFEITILKLFPHFPGANELNQGSNECLFKLVNNTKVCSVVRNYRKCTIFFPKINAAMQWLTACRGSVSRKIQNTNMPVFFCQKNSTR